MIAWSGVFHILATPFRDDGALDTEGLPRLVECALATGITGFTILGIAGEAHRLTDEERRRVVETVVKEVRGRVPVTVGVSASGTHLATAFARMAREHGADALMVAPPTGLKNLDAVAEYYRIVAAATGLPIVLQDEPVTTQVNMPAPFIAQLCADLPAIQAVKLEEPPTLPKITRLRALFGSRVAIFGGLGGVYFFEELSRGADGAMTGFPYPEALRAIREHFVAGRRDEARALFYRWLPLIRYESQPGATPGTAVGIRKEILRRRG
ncbi:MAG TPA: dihydrodipicolinate synthase family protein, partial [Methylomirabilota bacterium]|nr:dihydrodipicolinate synthase family protein [Methylomirabilota bacterium]